MKKIGLLCLAVVLALGVMGGALAYWNETLEIVGTVNTGELDVQFSEQASNDPSNDSLESGKDPSECGTWAFSTIGDPETWDWTGTRYDYDVASIDCELVADDEGDENGDYQTLTITIDNAYPCYYGNIAFTIDNLGSIPAKVESIKLVKVSWDYGNSNFGEQTVDKEIEACTTYYVYAENGVVSPLTLGWPTTGADFSIHLSELAVGQIVPVAAPAAISGDICIHVEDGAKEQASYDFTIEIEVSQFNAD